jgi:hypothetical protein
MDSLPTPTARSSRRYAAFTVSGLASEVTSASSSTSNRSRRRLINRPMSLGDSVVGVPPPRKIEAIETSLQSGATASASRSRADT